MKSLIRKVVAAAALLVLCFSLVKLCLIQTEYKKGQEVYRKIAETVVLPQEEQRSGTAKSEQEVKPELKPVKGPRIDFETLKQMNADVVGFISIEGLGISYPIVRGTDNTHYLSYTFAGEKNVAGAIFMNCQNRADFTDGNTILYGHNMKNGSMFGRLKELKDETVCLANRSFYICLPEGNREYEIFSCQETLSGGEVYQIFRDKGTEYQKYLAEMQADSEIVLDTNLNETAEIVTLSTCIGDGNRRLVVQAKRIQP